MVDCVATSLKTANSQGILPVAPLMTFPNDVSWGRSPVTWVTGPGFEELPLAARQLVFDQLSQAIASASTRTRTCRIAPAEG